MNKVEIRVKAEAAGTYTTALALETKRLRIVTDGTITLVRTLHVDHNKTIQYSDQVAESAGVYNGPLGDKIEVTITGATTHLILVCES